MLMHPSQLQRIAHDQSEALYREAARDDRARQYLAACDRDRGLFARHFRRARA